MRHPLQGYAATCRRKEGAVTTTGQQGARDVLIIGAGIAGLCAAYGVGQAGYRVTLLEQGTPGGGASAARLGVLLPPLRQRGRSQLRALAAASFAAYPQFVAALHATTGVDVAYTACGVLRLSPRVIPVVPPQVWCPPPDLAHREPTLAAALLDVVGAVYTPQAAHLDTAALVRALTQAITAAGGQIGRGTVRHLLHAGGTVRGAVTDDGTPHYAAVTLVAAGIATRDLLAPYAPDLPLEAKPGMLVQLAVAPPHPTHIVVADDTTIVAKRDGAVWAGGGSNATDAASIAATVARVLGKPADVVTTWQGVRPVAPAAVPLIAPVTGWAGLAVVSGHGKNGFLLAPHTTTEVVRVVQAMVAAQGAQT